MSEFAPNLPAAAVDARLRAAVADPRHAEQRAVLWFAELMRRRLYRDCGYASIHARAAKTGSACWLPSPRWRMPVYTCTKRGTLPGGDLPLRGVRRCAAALPPPGRLTTLSSGFAPAGVVPAAAGRATRPCHN